MTHRVTGADVVSYSSSVAASAALLIIRGPGYSVHTVSWENPEHYTEL